ncbi:MAG TPA: zinc ribbon domain-containing protein [Clostridiales bacterium]|nr:zinc ribbon domain-containing protein [Clostridiales bacterium]
MSKIPGERKALYYVGMGMIVLGFVLFLSVFFSAASMMNDPFMSGPPPFANAVFGMILIVAGGIVRNVGARGTAGSGIILDPDKAREDLKPYNEAMGGMINDVISNVDALDNVVNKPGEKEVVKIRCRNCQALNDEDAKFCKSCGQLL